MSKTRRALLWLLALALLKAPLDALLANLLPDASVNMLPGCMAGAAVSLLLLGLPALRLRPWTSERLVRRGRLWEGILLGALISVLTRAALTPVDVVWQGWLSLSPEVLSAPQEISAAVACVIMLAAVPALTEEAFFRGALLTGLLDGSRRATAALLTTLAFTLMHDSAANLPSLLAVSLMLTLLMLYTGRVAVPVTAHFVYNLLALVPVRLPVWGSLLAGAVLVSMAGWMCIRQPKRAHLPIKAGDGLLACMAMAVLAALYLI